MKLSKLSLSIHYITYAAIITALCLYSYVLIDPNLTFFNNSLWADFREVMVQVGYYQRPLSVTIYMIIVTLLIYFNFIFTKAHKQINLRSLSLVTGGVLLVSYPLLSHDLFNYMFDARILTFYYENPYTHKALDFPQDDWLRFMHWTHRTYNYGPSFLVFTLIPSFLSLGKFILNFIFFKAMFTAFYLVAIYYLQKMNKKWAVFFATSPLVLIEGLVNAHNDLLSVALGLAGVYYLLQNRQVLPRVFLLLSVGIKYTTLPIIGLVKKWPWTISLSFVGQLTVLCWLTFFMEIQPWYFLTLLIYLPFFERFISRIQIFFTGLLFSYYPYILYGGWDKPDKVEMKHQIILVAFLINIIYLIYSYRKDYLQGNFSVDEFLFSKGHI